MTILHEIFNTRESRINFLKGCIWLAKVDGIVCDAEKKFITDAASGFMLSDIDKNHLFSYMSHGCDALDFCFDNNKQNIMFVKEAIQLCYADGIFCELERSSIDMFARHIGLSSYAVGEIDKWVVRGIEWVKDGERLLETLK